jgi:hypothetical protein
MTELPKSGGAGKIDKLALKTLAATSAAVGAAIQR